MTDQTSGAGSPWRAGTRSKLIAHATIVKAATIAAALDAATGRAKDELIAGSDEVTRPP
jgi:hypothetical protein